MALCALAMVFVFMNFGTGQRICCDGDIWLKWNLQERSAYIWGFSAGYANAYESACANMAKLWNDTAEPRPNEPYGKCLATAKDLTRSTDYYVDAVTVFYSRYPADREISMEEVLAQLAKGLTVEQVHHYPFPRHAPPPDGAVDRK